jgi:hypothetical protein
MVYISSCCIRSILGFLLVTGFELRASHLLDIHFTNWATLPALFCVGYDRVSWTISWGWLCTSILPISATWVARITGVSHRVWLYASLGFSSLVRDQWPVKFMSKYCQYGPLKIMSTATNNCYYFLLVSTYLQRLTGLQFVCVCVCVSLCPRIIWLL